ncbi:nucleotidyltransferase domain-containing protein [Candidatus Woesearchaeota archaeon]|nr:nucleotidyltransferase domain-containing protein [Candidatus Woesearchaeota archaeon]
MVDTYKLKLTSLQAQIFQLLCKRVGVRMSQREIALDLDVSATAVGKALKGLDFVDADRSSKLNLTLVQLMRDKKFVELKRAENVRQIYSSGLCDYLENKYSGSTIVLFGSYSLGEDTVKSDIDIAIIGGKEKKLDLVGFEKELERTIVVNYYSNFKIHKNLKQNIFNGIVLQGQVEI